MRVLLIQAAVHDTHLERAQPLGLMCLAAYLRATRGDEVRLYDQRLDWRRLDPALQAFREFRPDAVGIGAHSVDAPALHRLAQAIKAVAPQTPVIAGGIHSTLSWKEILADQAVDYAAIGEGENTLREWLDALVGGAPEAVPGLAFRRDGRIERSAPRELQPHLDRFPYPAWDLIDLDAYGRLPRIGVIGKRRRYMAVETARGCPFSCAWCHHSMGDKFRARSADNVVEMFARLRRDFQVADLMIIDDLFNFRPERVEEILTGVLERDLRLDLAIPNGLRADFLDDRLLRLMRDAGVYRIMIAVETASPRLQKDMGKHLDLEKARRVIAKATELGISVHGNFMIGLPTETEPEMRATIRFAARSRLDTFGLYRATPFKGTTLYEMAKKSGVILPDGETAYSFWDTHLNVSPIPLEVLNRARRWSYPYFYLRPGRLWRLLRRFAGRPRLLLFLTMFFFKKLVSK